MPDGLYVAFYQGCWDTVKGTVCNSRIFFANGTNLRLINHTNVALIPKV